MVEQREKPEAVFMGPSLLMVRNNLFLQYSKEEQRSAFHKACLLAGLVVMALIHELLKIDLLSLIGLLLSGLAVEQLISWRRSQKLLKQSVDKRVVDHLVRFAETNKFGANFIKNVAALKSKKEVTFRDLRDAEKM